MININGKKISEIELIDIKEFLNDYSEKENFFVELKNDQVTNKDFIKEFCAFCNTYGGYVFLGVENDKSISGCVNWTENRIHTVVHDSITPSPFFEVKEIQDEINNKILIIKIEEGGFPPYITNSGKIFTRVSSGSYPINDSNNLNQLYYKRKDNIKKLENKLFITDINNPPENLCAYLDIGFEPKFKENKKVNIDFNKISKILSVTKNEYSISKVGNNIDITVGELKGDGEVAYANMHNFIEIMHDGSVKLRIVMFVDEEGFSNVLQIPYIISKYIDIYNEIMGKALEEDFIEAKKYEKLTVVKQFKPMYQMNENDLDGIIESAEYNYENHVKKYGNNIIVSSSRKPYDGFYTLDREIIKEIRKNIQQC